MEHAIKTEGLFYRYHEESEWAVNNISISVSSGEWLAIVGHNGSGKSTLARLLNGLLIPDMGSVFVEGFTTTESSSLREIRRRVGMVFQNPDSQFVGTTVRDDIAFG